MIVASLDRDHALQPRRGNCLLSPLDGLAFLAQTVDQIAPVLGQRDTQAAVADAEGHTEPG